MKNDDRARKNMEKRFNAGIRKSMGRSSKPDPERKEKEQMHLNED